MHQSERRLAKYPFVVRWLLRPLARAASRTIAVSAFLAERLSELELAVRPVVIPNVVSVSEPTAFPTTPPFAIAHVSIMGPAKNLPGLLEAVRLLRERRTDFVLRLVGDGECRADARGTALSRHGTRRDRRVRGAQERRRGSRHPCDLCVHRGQQYARDLLGECRRVAHVRSPGALNALRRSRGVHHAGCGAPRRSRPMRMRWPTGSTGCWTISRSSTRNCFTSTLGRGSRLKSLHSGSWRSTGRCWMA